MNSSSLLGVSMPADPPFIVPSAHPFKVEATPSKMGGVDALAKRPLDMSGQPDPMAEHLASAPPESTHPDTWVTLPSDTPGRGGEGPTWQEQIDTSHREYFDDPSRYLRTDAVVRVTTMDTAPGDPAATVAVHGVIADADAASVPPNATEVVRARVARGEARKARAAQLARQSAVNRESKPSASPQQRRSAFNERLAGIMARQQQINEELSAVEQAVQATRTLLESHEPHQPHQPGDEPD